MPRFAIDQMFARGTLDYFLDRAAARADSRSDAVRQAIDRARSGDVKTLEVSESMAKSTPAVASFLKGLNLLANDRIEEAADAFRGSLRADSEFLPAMVYLGACYAAGGKDPQAAGAWQTALISENESAAVHVLLADALLRQRNGQGALDAIDEARSRWPEDPVLKQRYVAAALMAGRHREGLDALDAQLAGSASDGPLLIAGMQTLYEAHAAGRPVDSADADRARMARYAQAYAALNLPPNPQVEGWKNAVIGR